MSALVLSPHNDDAELFCAFSALQTRADVIVVLQSEVQELRYGITAETRERETNEAMYALGLHWQQWPFLDGRPPWPAIEQELRYLDTSSFHVPPEIVFAPAIEEDGHEHHNRIGALALEVFGDRVVSYLTYTRSGGRSRNGTEVVPEPDWVARKHRALACYRSQIAEPSCAPWFLGDLREYVL